MVAWVHPSLILIKAAAGAMALRVEVPGVGRQEVGSVRGKGHGEARYRLS